MSNRIELPGKLNIWLSYAAMAAAIALLWAASHVDSSWKIMGLATLFALVGKSGVLRTPIPEALGQ